MVLMGLYLLTLYVSSLIFKPLGEYVNMIISTIIALFVSSYIILRWKKGFKIRNSKFFASINNTRKTTNDRTNSNDKAIPDFKNIFNRNTNSHYEKKPYIFVKTNVECRSRINTMNGTYFEKLINHFPTPRYQLRSDQIIFLFRNYSEEEIIDKVNELIVDEIYDNLSIARRKEPEDVLRRNISQICKMDIKTFNSLCNDFSVPKYYKKEGKVQFLLNNYLYDEIMEKTTGSK